MVTRRKTPAKKTRRKTPAKKRTTPKIKHALYIVRAKFDMKSVPIPKSEADKLAARARKQGGTVTVKKA